MKKYILIFTVVLFTLLTACNKENLELNPHASIGADVALTSVGDFENAVNGLYLQMIGNPSTQGSYSDTFMSFPDVLADNLIFVQTGRQTQRATYEWRYNANNTQTGFMAAAYRVIQQANFILENIDKLPDGDQKNNIIAQAKAARALNHFTLNNVFGQIPTQSTGANAALGVPVMTSSDIRQLPSRNTVAEVYTAVIQDLLDARALVSASNGIDRFNADAINGLLSRVYLYNGQNALAVEAADLVGTSVATLANFSAIWSDMSDDGVLFELKNFDADTDVSIGVPYSQTLGPGEIRSEYAVSFPLFNLYQNIDVRKAVYVETSAFGSNLYNHVGKYLSSSVNTGSGVVDVQVVRAAEVQLNKAEALAEIGGQDVAALAALDLVRSQRYLAFSGGETGQALKDAIQLERRLELAFEGHRFFDLKRKGSAINRTSDGDIADGSGTPPNFLTLPSGDSKFQLPIPKQEIDLNPNMVQNPGY